MLTWDPAQAQLAQILMARLAYANLKVNQGWIKQNIDEVEHLYSSRFRSQAEQRRPTSKPPGSRARASRAALPPLQEETNDNSSYQHLLQAQGAVATQKVPARRPFVDEPSEDPVLPTQPPAYSGHYVGYTPTFYSGYEQPAQISLGPGYDQAQQVGSDNHQSVMTSDHTSSKPGPPSPLQSQAAHSMYSYLASPVAPYTAQFASPHTADGNPVKSSVGSASITALHTQQQAWKGSDPSAANHPPFARNIVAASGAYPPYQADLGTPGVSAPMGAAAAQYSSAQDALQQYPMAPVPAITPRPDVFNPTFPNTFTSKPVRHGQQQVARAGPARGHLRNPSLKGEYSVSSVTMDDLDSHFGQ